MNSNLEIANPPPTAASKRENGIAGTRNYDWTYQYSSTCAATVTKAIAERQ